MVVGGGRVCLTAALQLRRRDGKVPVCILAMWWASSLCSVP